MTCDRCDELQAEVEYLKGELGLSVSAQRLSAIRTAFNLPPARARLLLVLFAAKGRVVSPAQALDAMPPRYGAHDRGWENVKTHICRLRKQVDTGLIVNVWGEGYRLTDAGMARVTEILAAS